MLQCLFATDLHGHIDRYEKLFKEIVSRGPDVVFLGGDLLPHPLRNTGVTERGFSNFIKDFLAPGLNQLRKTLGNEYPAVLAILGNDDYHSEEREMLELDSEGLCRYIHNRKTNIARHAVYGYAFVPPTPFALKDWERYDVSRYVPPGSVSPEEGRRSGVVAPNILKYSTIRDDLDKLAGRDRMERAVFLFHGPPHETRLDRAALDGKMIDHVPLDLHVGSIAIRRFIEARQPLLTLHGHIHESTRLTGSWRDRLGRTYMFNGAHDGDELALIEFDMENLDAAARHLI